MKRHKKWVKDLKLAFINEDEGMIEDLYETMPDFKNLNLSLNELEEVQIIIAHTIDFLYKRRLALSKDMQEMEQSMAYMEAN